jgi:protein associated with RNAse G/E
LIYAAICRIFHPDIEKASTLWDSVEADAFTIYLNLDSHFLYLDESLDMMKFDEDAAIAALSNVLIDTPFCDVVFLFLVLRQVNL